MEATCPQPPLKEQKVLAYTQVAPPYQQQAMPMAAAIPMPPAPQLDPVQQMMMMQMMANQQAQNAAMMATASVCAFNAE